MSLLEELNTTLQETGIPVETGVFSKKPPNEYLVITPLNDSLELYADNHPRVEVEEARLSLFSKKNYIKTRNQLTRILLKAGFIITDRRYIGHEDDTGYHHYTIDVAKEYVFEEES